MHIDIAGTAFNHAEKGYQTIGGTGVGVRMMIDFLSKQCSTTKK
jgi:leucyl aminopeptidase